MKQNGLEIDHNPVSDPTAKIDVDRPGAHEVKIGKKKFLRIVVE